MSQIIVLSTTIGDFCIMQDHIPHTEQPGKRDHLEQLSVHDLLKTINAEDQTVAGVVKGCIPKLVPLVEKVAAKMAQGGRLFYLGAGTSGRLGVVDASECPPTFGVEHGRVIGLIAGGDAAIRKAVEFAEDDDLAGWKDLLAHQVGKQDVVIGIAASGNTPYVVGALKQCRKHEITTGCITCNENSPLEQTADFPLVAIVGPEVVTGSTRMKAGTAQKLLLNMLSTSVMIRLGRVKGNRMVDMQPANNKLIDRGARMIAETLGCSLEEGKGFLAQHGSVRAAIEAQQK